MIRRGQVAFERTYRHDYDAIYGEDAKKPGSLNATDLSGPATAKYGYKWWLHPYGESGTQLRRTARP